jgi:hypothetical protein
MNTSVAERWFHGAYIFMAYTVKKVGVIGSETMDAGIVALRTATVPTRS